MNNNVLQNNGQQITTIPQFDQELEFKKKKRDRSFEDKHLKHLEQVCMYYYVNLNIIDN